MLIYDYHWNFKGQCDVFLQERRPEDWFRREHLQADKSLHTLQMQFQFVPWIQRNRDDYYYFAFID